MKSLHTILFTTLLCLAAPATRAIDVELNIVGNNGRVPSKAFAEFLTADGERVCQTQVADGHTEVKGLPESPLTLRVTSEAFEPFTEHFHEGLEQTPTLNITLTEELRKPFNLVHTSKADGDTYTVTFHWNERPGFYDSFDTYRDFTTTFSQWRVSNYNTEPSYPITMTEGDSFREVNFPGSSLTGRPASGMPMVFNPSATHPACDSDPDFLPADGAKYMIFPSAAGARADKWLTSTNIKILEGFHWQFMAKGIGGFDETIELCVNIYNYAINGFRTIDTIHPTSEDWEYYSIDLSEYAGSSVWLGYHYCSNDGYLVAVDSVAVGIPGQQPVPEVDYAVGFQAVIDGEEGATISTSAHTLAIPDFTQGHHTLALTTLYATGRSDTVVYDFILGENSVEAIIDDEAFSEPHISVAPGTLTVSLPFWRPAATIQVFTPTGALVASHPLPSTTDTYSFSLPRGLYIVTLGTFARTVSIP